MNRSRRCRVFLSLILGLGLGIGTLSGGAVVKLFLKDGTFQLVKGYEVHGDRVRYYSVERSEWEEVPTALVDFEATERSQKEERAAEKKHLDEARKIERQRFEAPTEAGLEIAPGIRLPQEEGVFGFDNLRVIHLLQSSAEVLKDKKRAALLLALPGPVLKNRAWVVLPGARAALRIAVSQPTFYVRSAEGLGKKLELISLKPAKKARLVERIEWRAGIGKPAELRAVVPVERIEVAPGLFRLKPTQALALGEYALGELTQQKLNLDLWDFGIDGTEGK